VVEKEVNSAAQSYTAWAKAVEEGKQVAKEGNKPWWVPSITIEKARDLLKTLPSLGLGSPKRAETPIFTTPLPGNLLSFGTVSAVNSATDGTPHVRINPNSTGISGRYNNITTSASFDPKSGVFSATARVASPVRINENGTNAGLGYSASARLEINQIYNATMGMDINYVDMSIKGDGGKGSLTEGAYIKVNPWIAAGAALVVVFTPFDEFAAAGGGLLVIAREVIKHLGNTIPLPDVIR
jgi:hypothetical protein